MITYDDKKMTANQAAKQFVFERGAVMEGYWQECDSIAWDTLKECAELDAAIVKQTARACEFFGIDKLPRETKERVKDPQRPLYY